MGMKELRTRVNEFAERFGLNPLHLYGGLALLAALLLAVAIGLVAGGGSSPPAARPNSRPVTIAPAATPTELPRTSPSPDPGSGPTGLPPNLAAVAAPPAAPVTTAIHPVTISAPGIAGSAASPAPPQTTAVAVANVTSLLPAQPAPPGIKPGLVAYQIQTAPEGAPGGTPWVEIGTAVVSAPTTSFSTTPPPGLMVPSDGQVRDVLRFWFRVAEGGNQVMTLHLSGNAIVTAALTMDGRADPMLTAKLAGGSLFNQAVPITQVAGIGLAEGWHQAQLDVTRTLIRGLDYKAAADIYIRGPNDRVPVALIPASVPAAASAVAAHEGAQ